MTVREVRYAYVVLSIKIKAALCVLVCCRFGYWPVADDDVLYLQTGRVTAIMPWLDLLAVSLGPDTDDNKQDRDNRNKPVVS